MTAPAKIKKKKVPTNADLLLAMEEWRREDREEVDRRLNGMSDRILGLPAKADLTAIQTNVESMHRALFDTDLEPKFATKSDVQPVVDLYKKLTLSAQIVGSGGKWTSRFILGVAACLIALGVITGGIKGALAGIASWALSGR